MKLHRPRMSMLDLVVLIAILATIMAVSRSKIEAFVAFSALAVYSSLLAAFVGPLTKLERFLWIALPTIAVIFILPAIFAVHRSQ